MTSLQTRIVSAAILAPIVLGCLIAGGTVFHALLLLIAVAMGSEWHSIISHNRPELDKKTSIYGMVYISLFVLSCLFLRQLENGFVTVLILMLAVWATDIGAYFAGKTIGGPKIAPEISPNKTWAGLAGGVVSSALLVFFAVLLTGNGFNLMWLLFGAVLAVVAQVGDFFESALKRHYGVKDSGWLIPGHGGVMDRVDGLMAVFPLCALITILKGGNFFG